MRWTMCRSSRGRTRDCMIPADKSGNYYYGLRDFVKERSVMNMDLIFDKYPNELIHLTLTLISILRSSVSLSRPTV